MHHPTSHQFSVVHTPSPRWSGPTYGPEPFFCVFRLQLQAQSPTALTSAPPLHAPSLLGSSFHTLPQTTSAYATPPLHFTMLPLRPHPLRPRALCILESCLRTPSLTLSRPGVCCYLRHRSFSTNPIIDQKWYCEEVSSIFLRYLCRLSKSCTKPLVGGQDTQIVGGS